MVGCVLTGHGVFAEGVGAALEMVGGPQQDFAKVTFLEDEAGEFPAKISGAIAEMAEKCGEVVVFCDLMGGTPFNQSMMITAEQDNVSVVAGTNLPMLIDIVMARTEDSTVEDLVAEAVEVGKEGVCHMSLDASAGMDDDEDE